jgi:hypothetical protein
MRMLAVTACAISAENSMSGLNAQRFDRPNPASAVANICALVSDVLRDSHGDGASSSKISLEARENFVECLAATS